METYKQRIREEYFQLKERTNKLGIVIGNYRNDTLDFKLTYPIDLLESQFYIMCAYLNILKHRADLEGIVLSD